LVDWLAGCWVDGLNAFARVHARSRAFTRVRARSRVFTVFVFSPFFCVHEFHGHFTEIHGHFTEFSRSDGWEQIG
jgi:hypothetical protein